MQEKLEKKVYVSFITNCQACFSNVERTLIFILDRENDIVVVRLALFTSRFFPLPHCGPEQPRMLRNLGVM
jgi:hypothetical protein